MTQDEYEYNSVLKAIRKVKNLLVEEERETVILLFSEYFKSYYVFTSKVSVAMKIEELFNYTNAAPEEFAKDMNIAIYVTREQKDKYGITYKNYKNSVFSKEFCRGYGFVVPEYSVSFNCK